MTPKNNMPVNINIELITPSYRADIDRFARLRQSINRYAPGIKHHALVDTEDYAEFRDRFGNENDLSIIPSKDLLSKKLERDRIQTKKLKHSWVERLARKINFETNPMRGWHAQQFLKIHFLSQIEKPLGVFLDSDIQLTKTLSASDFLNEEGSFYLLEGPAKTIEEHGFEVSTHILLGKPVFHETSFFSYIHQAPRFSKETGILLLNTLNKVNQNTSWEYRFTHQQWPSEYHLLGHTVREIQKYDGYIKKKGPPENWLYEIRENGSDEYIRTVFSQIEHEKGSRGFLLIQSNLKNLNERLINDSLKKLSL